MQGINCCTQCMRVGCAFAELVMCAKCRGQKTRPHSVRPGDRSRAPPRCSAMPDWAHPSWLVPRSGRNCSTQADPRENSQNKKTSPLTSAAAGRASSTLATTAVTAGFTSCCTTFLLSPAWARTTMRTGRTVAAGRTAVRADTHEDFWARHILADVGCPREDARAGYTLAGRLGKGGAPPARRWAQKHLVPAEFPDPVLIQLIVDGRMMDEPHPGRAQELPLRRMLH